MGATTQGEMPAGSPLPGPAWSASAEEGPDALAWRALPSPAPITCQPWCEAQDGHPNQRLREDQCCFGRKHRVPLSNEPVELIGHGSTQQQYLSTYLLRPADDTASRVFIGYNEAPGRTASLAEARRFALEILALVDGIDT